VRRNVARTGRFLILPTLALVVVAVLLPGRVELATRMYALLLCGLALLLAIGAFRESYPPEAPLRPKRPKRTRFEAEPPPTLAQIERETRLAAAGPFDLEHRLRPRLRLLATSLLAARRGISLDGDPDSAREILGDETWELVCADRPPPPHRMVRRVTPALLARLVDSLERL
jgi:hypothetical protein